MRRVKIDVKEIKKAVKSINPFSKYMMIYGGILVICLYIGALILFCFKGSIAGYYEDLDMCYQLLSCAKDCLGASFVPALLLEIIHIAEGTDKK